MGGFQYLFSTRDGPGGGGGSEPTQKRVDFALPYPNLMDLIQAWNRAQEQGVGLLSASS